MMESCIWLMKTHDLMKTLICWTMRWWRSPCCRLRNECRQGVSQAGLNEQAQSEDRRHETGAWTESNCICTSWTDYSMKIFVSIVVVVAATLVSRFWAPHERLGRLTRWLFHKFERRTLSEHFQTFVNPYIHWWYRTFEVAARKNSDRTRQFVLFRTLCQPHLLQTFSSRTKWSCCEKGRRTFMERRWNRRQPEANNSRVQRRPPTRTTKWRISKYEARPQDPYRYTDSPKHSWFCAINRLIRTWFSILKLIFILGSRWYSFKLLQRNTAKIPHQTFSFVLEIF